MLEFELESLILYLLTCFHQQIQKLSVHLYIFHAKNVAAVSFLCQLVNNRVKQEIKV